MVQVVVVDGDADRRSTLTTENMMDVAVFAGRESLMEDARAVEEDDLAMIKIDDARLPRAAMVLRRFVRIRWCSSREDLR